MSGLLGLLDLGAGALAAQNAGVSVTGRNTANVNTQGYSRQSVILSAELGAPLIGGVRAGGLSRSGSELLASRERAADGDRGHSQAMSEAMMALEQEMAGSGGNIVDAIAALFGGIVDLASAPFDPALRGDVVSRAQEVAASFRAAAESIARGQHDADARLAARAEAASRLAGQIASLNKAIGTNTDPVLQDQRDLAARQLSELTGGQARIDADGMMRVIVGGGTVLVDGDRAATLQATPDAATGHFRLEVADGSHVGDVTAALGGSMGGDISFRDGAAAQAAASLDQLAFDFASQVNAVHRANAGQDGVTGRDFFVAPAGAAGAAAAMAVDPALVADPRRLAAAAAGGAAGDNSGALALAALKDQALAGGGSRSFIDEALRTVRSVGAAAQSAASTYNVAVARSDALASTRDSLSGVSTEEEMSRLAQFQHAHQASVEFISVVDGLLDHLIANL